MNNKKHLAWHFLRSDKTLGYGDGRVCEVGKTYSATGKPALCCNGMHGSRRAIDAVGYAPGPIVCLVEISGNVEVGDDKIVGQHRKIIAMADATKVLHLFACRIAKDALDAEKKAGREPDIRSYAAIEAKHKYLNGEISESELSAAESAARSAARSVARSAARSVAWSAAWSAARSAAESAAWSAAESAARSVAWSAAWSVTESAAWSAAESAARSAAESAARSAAESAQNIILSEMLLQLLINERGELK